MKTQRRTKHHDQAEIPAEVETIVLRGRKYAPTELARQSGQKARNVRKEFAAHRQKDLPALME